jgi:hypothetical protein
MCHNRENHFYIIIIYCFTSCSRIFHLYEDVTITGEGLQNLGQCSVQGLRAGRDLNRATPAVTQGLCFSSLIRRTAPFSRLLPHTRGCGGSILARIYQSPFTTHVGMWRIYSCPDPHGYHFYMFLLKKNLLQNQLANFNQP